MMMKLLDDENNERKKNKGSSDDAKKSLKRLLKSGIPGVEKIEDLKHYQLPHAYQVE